MAQPIDTTHLLGLSFAMAPDDAYGASFTSSTVFEPIFDASTTDDDAPPAEVEMQSIHVTLDGMPPGACPSPWNTRRSASEKPAPIFAILSTTYFWFRMEYAFRNAFVVVLPCALLAYLPSTTALWAVPGVMVAPFAIVVHGFSVGMTLMLAVGALKGLLLFLVVGQVTYAIDPGRHWAGWGVWFFFVVLFVAMFTKGLVTKLGLFGFIIHAVLNFKHGLNQPITILEFIKAPLVGIAFGIAGSLLPFPRFETFKAERILDELYQVQAMLLLGLTESIFAMDQDRRINLVRLRMLRALFDRTITELNTSLFLSQWEVWFRNRQAQVASRRSLSLQLLVSIDSMLEVLERTHTDPALLDNSGLFQKFKKIMFQPISQATVELEGVLAVLRKNGEVKDVAALTRRLRQAKDLVGKTYPIARSKSIMPAFSFGDQNPWKHYPFITSSCFFFAWENAVASVLAYKPPAAVAWHAWVIEVLLTPVQYVVGFWADLVGLVQLQPHRVLEATEAFKLAFACITAVSFLLSVKLFSNQDPASGTATIAFLMDANPTANVGTGWRFLLGCVVGSVYGLITTSGSQQLRDNIIWMVVVAGILGFAKVGHKWGETAFFTMFFALSTMAPGHGAAALVATMQTNVLAVTWLGLVSTFLFPQWSTARLQTEVADGVLCTRKALVEMLRNFENCVGDCKCTTEQDAAIDGQLEANIERARQSTVAQAQLAEDAADEPSLGEHPLPAQSYVAFTQALKLVVSQLASTMIATRITIKYEQLNPAPQAQCVALVLRPFTTALEVFLLELEETLRHVVRTSADLVKRQAEIKRISLRILADAEQAFCEQGRQLADGTLKIQPFRVPAMQQVLHCIRTLPGALDALMLATMELSRVHSGAM